jgi:LmbE family N-acetylglucosaminyl deacetylase
MLTQINLKKIQKIIPASWLYYCQYIHSSLLLQWIITWGSKPLILTQKSVMVFSPHQDDETFACGGMISLKCQQEIPVIVVFLTDGRGSGNSSTDAQNMIIKIRQQEALTALNILGVKPKNIHFLNKIDGTLNSLSLADKNQTISEISQLLNSYQPGEVYVPHYKDGHRDHQATYQLLQSAIAKSRISVELFQYPVWLSWRAPLFIYLKLPDIRSAYRLSSRTVQTKKNQAIAAYASQIKSLPPNFTKQFQKSEEIFFRSNP